MKKVLLLSLALSSVLCAKPIRFEAETVAVPPLPKDPKADYQGWFCWTKDPQGKKVWSGAATLRSPIVKEELIPGKTAPIVKFSIPVEKAGLYSLRVAGFRNFGISWDNGKSWQPMSAPCKLFPRRRYKAGEKIEFLLCACYPMGQGKNGPTYIDYFELDDANPNRFEAESVAVTPLPRDPKDDYQGWYCWTKDPQGKKVWSDAATLRSPIVKENLIPCKTAPIVKFSIPVEKEGTYSLSVAGFRNVGISWDNGKTWRKMSAPCKLFPRRHYKAGDQIEFQLCACYPMERGNNGPTYIDYFELNAPDPVELKNGDLQGKIGDNGVPENWEPFSFMDKKDWSKILQITSIPGETTVKVRKGGRSIWVLTNLTNIYGEPGDMFEVTADVQNTAKIRQEIYLQFVGLVGRTIVNYEVAQRIMMLNPGERVTEKAVVALPKNCEYLRFRYVATGDNTVLRKASIRYIGNAIAVSDKVKFNFADQGKVLWQGTNAELSSENDSSLRIAGMSGKQWEVHSLEARQALPGEGLRITFNVAAAPGTKGKLRMRLGTLYCDAPARKALNPAEWHEVTDKITPVTVDVPMPMHQCEKLSLAFDGFGDLTLNDLKLKAIPRPAFEHPFTHKVPILAHPAPPAELGRGVIVRPMADGSAYVSWRITAQDDPQIAFDVFAEVNGKLTKLNADPVKQTSDFIVKKPVAGAVYHVRPTKPFTGVSGSAALDAKPWRTYMLAHQEDGIYGIAPADLDGDGEYDYVVRSCASNIDPISYNRVRNAKPFHIDAFLRNGKRLWSLDLGPNIEMAMWANVMCAADLDGDGKAEVITKGSAPADGDWREDNVHNLGRVISGPEYLMVLDGMTGKELARAPWPPRDGFFDAASAHSCAQRNQLAIFRPDGKTNCILALRGTYALMLADAWKFENGKLVKLWSYSNRGLDRKWNGQGSHNTRIADLDGDGRDEIILGGAVLDDDGSPLWSTGHGHPDYIFVGDITKSNPGLEVYSIYETATTRGGITVADGKTGKVVWELDRPVKHGHIGYAGDLDPRFRGWECGGTDVTLKQSYHFSPDGKLLGLNEKAPYHDAKAAPHFIYWDADLQREHFGSDSGLYDHRGGDCGTARLPGKFIAAMDTEGDWREEIAVRINGGFALCGTTIPAMDRRPCLMTDDIYRHSVLANSSGYIFDLSLSYLLNDRRPNLNVTVLNDDSGTVETVVSAPLHRGVAGRVTLTPPAGVKLTPAAFSVKLAPGEIKVLVSKMENPGSSVQKIGAAWQLDDGTILRGSVPAATNRTTKWSVPAGMLAIEAENFTGQKGGFSRIRSDKQGVSKRSISHWDAKGHALTWDFEAPKAGSYRLKIRYCSTKEAVRKVICNGRELGTLVCPPTGGGGDTIIDWQIVEFPVQLPLNAGKNSITLENVNGVALNMDCMLLAQ